MQQIIDEIYSLASQYTGTTTEGIDKLPQSGSDRIYFRVRTKGKSYIATYNKNVKENQTFINFSNPVTKNPGNTGALYYGNV